MSPRLLYLLPCLAFPLVVSAQQGVEAIFDLPVREGATIAAERFEEFFPSEFLAINVSLSEQDTEELLERIRHKIRSAAPPEAIPPEEHQFPLPYFFFSHLVDHDREGRLEQIMFEESSLPMRRIRVLRLVGLLRDAVGPPDTIEVRGRARSTMPSEIYVNWRRPQGRIRLELEADDLIHFGCLVRLDYFPNASPRLAYVDRAKKAPVELGSSPWETVMLFLEHHAAFRDGDGAFPPTPLAGTLEERLGQYAQTIGLKDSLSFRTNQRLNELHGRLEPALEAEFATDPVPDRYERLLELALNLRSGESQVGAAAFLARYDDPAIQPFLRRGLEVGLPSGVSTYSAKGLAQFCTGDILRQTVEDFLLDKRHAGLILRHLPTRKQIGELWKIRDQIPDGKNQRRLDGILTLAEDGLEEG